MSESVDKNAGLARIEQASQFLAVGRSKVYDMLAKRELPSVRIGSCRRIPWEALHEYVARNTTSAAIDR